MTDALVCGSCGFSRVACERFIRRGSTACCPECTHGNAGTVQPRYAGPALADAVQCEDCGKIPTRCGTYCLGEPVCCDYCDHTPRPCGPDQTPCDTCGRAATHGWRVARWHGTIQAGTNQPLPKVVHSCDAKACTAHAHSAAYIYSKGWDHPTDDPIRVSLDPEPETLTLF